MAVHIKSSKGIPLCRRHLKGEALFAEEWLKLNPAHRCGHCEAVLGLRKRKNQHTDRLDRELQEID